MVVIPQNYHQMEDIVRVAGEVGIKYVNLQTMNLASVPTWDKTTTYDLYNTRDFKLALNAAKRMALTNGVDLSTFEFEKEGSFQKCLLPWGHFYISWNGWMTPCCAKPFPKILNFGNVFKDGLMATLNTPEYRHFRTQWYKNETPNFCTRCHMIDIPKLDMSA